MLGLLAEHGIYLEPDAIQFVSSKLSEDWLVAWPSGLLNIRTSRTEKYGVELVDWAELIEGVYRMREIPGISEQIRRLCVVSHEALDTLLVLQVAARYAREGFSVEFEPNGRGCSDLLVQKESVRLYAEVKRENEQDHKHFLSIQACSNELLGKLDGQMRTWLEEKSLRLELKCSRPFSMERARAIADKLVHEIPSCEVGKEAVLGGLRGARYVVLQREHPPYFQKGLRKGFIQIKQPGTPVRLSPENMPVSVVFDRIPNLSALRARIRKASRQLVNDAVNDPGAFGFFVMQMSHGEAAKDAVMRRYFPTLPRNCLGVVLLSDPGFLIPLAGVPTEIVESMLVAAKGLGCFIDSRRIASASRERAVGPR